MASLKVSPICIAVTHTVHPNTRLLSVAGQCVPRQSRVPVPSAATSLYLTKRQAEPCARDAPLSGTPSLHFFASAARHTQKCCRSGCGSLRSPHRSLLSSSRSSRRSLPPVGRSQPHRNPQQKNRQSSADTRQFQKSFIADCLLLIAD